MKCLTSNECSSWLADRQIRGRPYDLKKADKFQVRFRNPRSPYLFIAFMRELVGSQQSGDNGFTGTLGKFKGALIAIEDWDPCLPDMLAMINSLRRSHGEPRPLAETPGHCFDPNEDANVIAHATVIDLYGWTAYLYLASAKATFLLWEGDIVDCWAADDACLARIKDSAEKFKFRIV